MTGLLLKDIFVLKKYFRTLLFICAFYVVCGYTTDNISYVSGLVVLIFSVMFTTSFFYDDAAKWNSYALTMPLNRKDLIFSKYLLSLCFIAIGFVVSLFCTLFLTAVKKLPITKELFIIIGAMIAIAVLFQCIMIPVIIKIGTEKARIAMIAIFMVPSLLVVAVSKMNIPKPSAATLHQLEQFMEHNLVWLAPIILLFLFVVSYFISTKFMEQNEF